MSANRESIIDAMNRDIPIKSSMTLDAKLKELKHEVAELERQRDEERFKANRERLGELLKDFRYVAYGSNLKHIALSKQLLNEHTSIAFDKQTGLLAFSDGYDEQEGGILVKEPGDAFHKAYLLSRTINNIASDVEKAQINSNNLDDILNTVNEVSWRYAAMFKELEDAQK